MLSDKDAHRGINVDRLAELVVQNPKLGAALLNKLAEKLGGPDDFAQYGLLVAANVEPPALEVLKALGHAASMINIRRVIKATK